MLKGNRSRLLFVAMFIVFGVTFYLGVFANPTFTVHDFCMNLASEVLGLLIALILVDAYVRERTKEVRPRTGPRVRPRARRHLAVRAPTVGRRRR